MEPVKKDFSSVKNYVKYLIIYGAQHFKNNIIKNAYIMFHKFTVNIHKHIHTYIVNVLLTKKNMLKSTKTEIQSFIGNEIKT